MRWSNDIVINPKKENLLFQGNALNKIKCVGKSTVVVGGEDFSNSFLVSMTEVGREEVVAVAVKYYNQKGQWTGGAAYLVGIEWKDNEPFVNPDKNWVSDSDNRLIAIGDEGHIILNAEGRWFSTNADRKNARLIGNADVALEYAVGHVDIDAVIAAAEETEVEISLSEKCAKLERDIKSVQEQYIRDVEEFTEISNRLCEENRSHLDTIIRMERKGKELTDLTIRWKEAAQALRKAVRGSFIQPKLNIRGRINGFITRKTLVAHALSLFPDENIK